MDNLIVAIDTICALVSPYVRIDTDEALNRLKDLDTQIALGCTEAGLPPPNPPASNVKQYGFCRIPYEITYRLIDPSNLFGPKRRIMTFFATEEWAQAMHLLRAQAERLQCSKKTKTKRTGKHGRKTDADGNQDKKQTEALSPLQYDILDALRDLKATDAEKRATGSDVATNVGGDATEQSVKAPLADLKRRGLVDSRTGRNGGTWLTPKGLNRINSLRPKK